MVEKVKKLTVALPSIVKNSDGKYTVRKSDDGEVVTKKEIYFVFGRDEEHAQRIAEIVLRTVSATPLEYRGKVMVQYAEAGVLCHSSMLFELSLDEIKSL